MLENLSKRKNITSFSVSPENFTGEKGKGGMSADGAAFQAARELGVGWKVSPYVNIQPGETFTMADVKKQGAIKHIWLTTGGAPGRTLILRIYWDGSDTPSVETPLGDFFADANPEQFGQLSSIAVCINPGKGLNCYWEMPFKEGFRMTLENGGEKTAVLYYQIDCEEKEIGGDSLYFHAQFRRTNPLPYKQVYTILDGIRGNGQYVGTYLCWGVNNNGWWGEGEIKFYIDGDGEFPTICGTGTEDYFCGAYNFDVKHQYTCFTTPYSGLYKIEGGDDIYSPQRRFNMYRWHIADPIYFKEDIKVTIQALGWRSGGRYLPLQDDISSVAFWYSDSLNDVYPPLPDKDYLEII